MFVALAFGIPLYRSITVDPIKPLPVLATLPNFKLTNQDGRLVSLSDYQGSVLVVNFIFTSCPDVCPLLTAQMKKIQGRLNSADQLARLVSISVDPVTDTPEVLKAYAEKYEAKTRQWSFLTGPFDDVRKVVVEGFKMPLTGGETTAVHAAAGRHSKMNHDKMNHGAVTARPDGLSDLLQITHGEHFVLVDQMGNIRGFERASNDSELNALVKKVAILMNSRPAARVEPQS